MFKLNIGQKLVVFSHIPGKKCILPGSCYCVQAYVSRLIIKNCENESSNEEIDILLDIKGPVKNFTISQNLEKCFVEVSGVSNEGYFRYILAVEGNKINLVLFKIPKKSINISINGKNNNSYKKSDVLSFPIKRIKENDSFEKLFLGMNKKLDIEKIAFREDLKEILPIWFNLSQTVPSLDEKIVGTCNLLKDLKEAIENKKDIKMPFIKAYKACFYDIFVPRLIDDQYQGIYDVDEKIPSDSSSFVILTYAKHIIRSMFFEQNDNTLKILPFLFKDFHSGRFLNIYCKDIGSVDIEWSKKLIRRMVLRAKKDTNIKLVLQPAIKNFRVRENNGDRGKLFLKNDKIFIKENNIYYFDRFKK